MDRPGCVFLQRFLDRCMTFLVPNAGEVQLRDRCAELRGTMVQQRRDSSGAFVLALAAGPFLLPVIGLHLRDLMFAIPLLTSVGGATMATAAARRRPERRLPWSWFAAACGIAAVASILGLVAAIAHTEPTAALYAGLGASGCVLAATALL